MSATLVYNTPQKNNDLSDRLKKIMIDTYKIDQNGPHTVTESDLSYFRGLRDAGVPDADRVCELIENFGRIELKLEY